MRKIIFPDGEPDYLKVKEGEESFKFEEDRPFAPTADLGVEKSEEEKPEPDPEAGEPEESAAGGREEQETRDAEDRGEEKPSS